MSDRQVSLDDIARLLADGDPLLAFDAANDRALDSLTGPDRIRHRYLRALALARCGATGRSAEELAGISHLVDDVDPRLAEDIVALQGRLSKDRALRATGAVRRAHFKDAARRYTQAFEQYGGIYSGINAASMWSLAGDTELSGRIAERLLHDLNDSVDATYWEAATRAEAHLVLGDLPSALATLSSAVSLTGADTGARASTARQLQLLCRAQGLDVHEITRALATRSVLHFCGHRLIDAQVSGLGAGTPTSSMETAVENALRHEDAGHAYGSLAAGADIIIAEAVLRAGGEVHVVLPFSIDEFIATSVRPSGDDWVERFHRCLEAATSVLITCDSGYAGDDSLYGYASAIAMGRARNLASSLAADSWQLAIWDGEPGAHDAGTAHDVRLWNQIPDARTVVIRSSNRNATGPRRIEHVQRPRRPVRALLFGDIQGFSKLYDEDLGPFIDTVLTTIASTIDRFGDLVIDRNTWGDGLFIAFRDAIAAARCALDLQEAIARLTSESGFELGELKMRISVHAGPVLSRTDPVRQVETVFGREITRAARIEPRTPPGEVYVSAALAALLRLDPDVDVVPEYVGRVTTAKDFETIPMYVLRRHE